MYSGGNDGTKGIIVKVTEVATGTNTYTSAYLTGTGDNRFAFNFTAPNNGAYKVSIQARISTGTNHNFNNDKFFKVDNITITHQQITNDLVCTSYSDYRYSYQGQERDDEIKGAGNSYNYKYRMHDPRLGRFFAVDPLSSKYPYNSPYAFSENRVIDGVELEGLEYRIVQTYRPVRNTRIRTTNFIRQRQMYSENRATQTPNVEYTTQYKIPHLPEPAVAVTIWNDSYGSGGSGASGNTKVGENFTKTFTKVYDLLQSLEYLWKTEGFNYVDSEEKLLKQTSTTLSAGGIDLQQKIQEMEDQYWAVVYDYIIQNNPNFSTMEEYEQYYNEQDPDITVDRKSYQQTELGFAKYKIGGSFYSPKELWNKMLTTLLDAGVLKEEKTTEKTNAAVSAK